jgi:hypothetical protein
MQSKGVQYNKKTAVPQTATYKTEHLTKSMPISKLLNVEYAVH